MYVIIYICIKLQIYSPKAKELIYTGSNRQILQINSNETPSFNLLRDHPFGTSAKSPEK